MDVYVRTAPGTGAAGPVEQRVGPLATLLHCGSVLSMALNFMDGDSISRNLDEPALDPCLAAFDSMAASRHDGAAFPRLWNIHVDWMREWMPKLKSGAQTEFSIPIDPDTIREDVRTYLLALIGSEAAQSGEALIASMNSLRWSIAVLDALGGALQNGGHTDMASQMQEGVEFFKQFYEGLYQVYDQQGEALIAFETS